MKLTNLEFINKLVAQKYSMHPNTGLNKHFKKSNKYFIVVIIIIAVVLANVTVHPHREFIMDLLSGGNLLIACILMLLIVLVFWAVFTVIHESLHIVASPWGEAEIFIVVDLPLTISIFFDGWIKRNRELLVLIFPFAVTTIVSITVSLILQNITLGVWLVFVCFATSYSDIFAFIYILNTIPSDAFICGHYYRC